jgi:hypothetical protein
MDLAKRLESDFVYAEQGKRYASALRRNAARGDYDGLKGAELALKLSDDFRALLLMGIFASCSRAWAAAPVSSSSGRRMQRAVRRWGIASR